MITSGGLSVQGWGIHTWTWMKYAQTFRYNRSISVPFELSGSAVSTRSQSSLASLKQDSFRSWWETVKKWVCNNWFHHLISTWEAYSLKATVPATQWAHACTVNTFDVHVNTHTCTHVCTRACMHTMQCLKYTKQSTLHPGRAINWLHECQLCTHLQTLQH